MYDAQRCNLRVAVIGPTDIDVTSRAAGLDPGICAQVTTAAGESLAAHGYTVVLVPDRGVALLAAEAYHRAGGPHLVGILPRGGTSAQQATSCCEQHRDLCDEWVEDLTWTGQHERICQLADVLLCIGMSCGTMAEVAWTKWVGGRPVIAIRPLMSGIAPEILAETDVRWVDDLEGALALLESMAGGKRRVGQSVPGRL